MEIKFPSWLIVSIYYGLLSKNIKENPIILGGVNVISNKKCLVVLSFLKTDEDCAHKNYRDKINLVYTGLASNWENVIEKIVNTEII